MTHEVDGTDALLADIRGLVRHAGLITARGPAVFFDRTDRTQQLAAKAIVIDLQTAVERLPEAYSLNRPNVAWAELRGMRNYLAHDYANTDYQIVWNAGSRTFHDCSSSWAWRRADSRHPCRCCSNRAFAAPHPERATRSW